MAKYELYVMTICHVCDFNHRQIHDQHDVATALAMSFRRGSAAAPTSGGVAQARRTPLGHRARDLRDAGAVGNVLRGVQGPLVERLGGQREPCNLVGGLVAMFYFPIKGISSSQLTFIFFRGVAQPPISNI